MSKEFIDIRVLAAKLSLPVSTLYQMVKAGDVPCYRFGRSIRFRVDEIETWVENKKILPDTIDRTARDILKSLDSGKRVNVDTIIKDEEKRLIDNCVLHPTIEGNKTMSRYWLQEIVLFALNTGMRQDEILSLEWPNVDLFRKTATVVRSKNGEKRTIPLNQRVFELLKSKAKVRNIRSKYVFANDVGNKIIASNVLRAFYKTLKRSGIEDFRFHDLRHTFATRLAQAGVDFYKIGKLLGHKDIRMTQRYSHHYPESLRESVEVLDNYFTITSQSNEKGLQLTP